MRIPEPLFPFINFVMKALLNSPMHGLMSANLMVIYFTGRKSGRRGAVPVRYLHDEDGTLFCLTSRETRWWPNFRQPAPVKLQLAGRRLAATALAVLDDEARKEALLRRMFERYPDDAVYHGVVIGRDRVIPEEQLRAAVQNGVAVLFTQVGGGGAGG